MSRAKTQHGVGCARHRGGADHLGDVDPRLPQFIRAMVPAEHLHIGLGVPAERIAVDDGGEPADDAVVEHAVHRRLTAGADRFTCCPISAKVARACSASSARMRSSVSSRRSHQRHLHPATNCRYRTSGAIDHVAIHAMSAIDCVINTLYRLS